MVATIGSRSTWFACKVPSLVLVSTFAILGVRTTMAVGFTDETSYSVGVVPFSIASADFNGDGRNDLAIANGNDYAISVLINNTDPDSFVPNFANQQRFPSSTAPTAIATGDINMDGRPDIVATGWYGVVSVLLNDAQPGSTSASFSAYLPLTGTNEVRSVALADMNGDGKVDIVTNIEAISAFAVWLNMTPAGATVASFAAIQTFDAGSTPMAVAAADLNLDGRPDLIAANNYYNRVHVRLNTTATGSGSVTMSASSSFVVGAGAFSLAADDMNGDAKPDLVVANAGVNTVSILLNATSVGASTPAFEPQSIFATGARPLSTSTADINGDGKPDVLTSNYEGSSVSVLTNMTNPEGYLEFAAKEDFATGSGARGVVPSDLNGDGMADLGVANSGNNSASVLLNTTAPYDPLFSSGFE